MSLYNVFNVAGSGMSAQSVRLNTVASNIANADVVSSSPDTAYRAREPIFATVFNHATGLSKSDDASVSVRGMYQSDAPARREYAPDNPMADKDGYVYHANVNPIEEMADMISASRSYQQNVEVMLTARQLLQSTLKLGE